MKNLVKRMLMIAVVGTLFVGYSTSAKAANIGYANVTQETLNAANVAHSYYGNKLPQDAITLAELNAKYYADAIMADSTLKTDLDRINMAAYMVSLHCAESVYGQDDLKAYKSPAGPFVYGVYTCAGSTRALGRILDYMGYNWYHVNENLNKHQWCIAEMDGQIGIADGMGGFAGYGEMVNGMTLPSGQVVMFAE